LLNVLNLKSGKLSTKLRCHGVNAAFSQFSLTAIKTSKYSNNQYYSVHPIIKVLYKLIIILNTIFLFLTDKHFGIAIDLEYFFKKPIIFGDFIKASMLTTFDDYKAFTVF
jgi:hypothetical protein